MLATEWPLRILLVVGALATISYMLLRIRSSKIAIKDSIFWIVFALALLLISIFPDITTFPARLLGFQAPINFVYLFIIFILLIKIFSLSMRLSMLDTRIQQLTQRIALDEKKAEDRAKEKS